MCSTPKSSPSLKAPTPLSIGLSLSDKYFHSTFRQSNENVERLQQQRLQEFNTKEPEFQQQIEIDQIRCPSHLIQFKQALKTLASHQTLKVCSHSSALIKDLAASGRILHCSVKTLRFRRQHFLYASKS
ncbi:MAG: hypothetical protein KAI17_13035 [Thiotrichaceae bacterium]|nr:hypothetical protein [Thiotrichaceae bacterium]